MRLQQGDYRRETVFSDDPVAMARQWLHQGADCLHLIDLDGARDGNAVNRATIARIVATVGVPCQVGGGIRDESAIEQLLGLGPTRLVIGTRALKEPEWFRAMCRRHPGRLVLGIDAREGRVATEGWREESETSAVELARSLCEEPIAAVVFTDIAQDGMLRGPNLRALAQMRRAIPGALIASGGIASAADVRQVAALGLEGCIVGRALYEGTLTLAETLQAAASSSQVGDPP